MRNLPSSFEVCEKKFARHSARWSGKIANNTYLEHGTDGALTFYAVRLHRTCIVTFYSNGEVLLNTGGWNTVTTRQRMRDCGVNVGTTAGVLTVRHGGNEWAFADSITLHANGTVSAEWAVPAAEEIRDARAAKRREIVRRRAAERERIRAHVKSFAAAAVAK